MTQESSPETAGQRAVATSAARRPPKRQTRGRIPWSLRLAVVVIYPTASLLFKLRYRHPERVPATGPVLLVANHVSVMDPLSCARLVWDAGRVPHFLAKQSVFKGLAGTILRHAGQIPVARDSTDAAGSLATARADLQAGNLVVIYPEGSVTRDPDWWPMQARTGVARLALTTDAAVVPVAQWGPQRVHDYHAKKLRLRPRQPADYLVGHPVDLDVLRAQVRAGRALSPDLLRETTDLIMGRVRDQLAELRGEPAPAGFSPRPRRSLPGDLPGNAA
ncbi:lysophospholipid acyltransferase family protein [Trujillonella endophytica]|uniref:lysophospholipid acyltransferase family protein n=1 Tax=Trujillonella endophytica TaxID=673521 RepID=UPI001FCD62D6|nr:lysophospholipid acyltransferase family protein [Trujillella endophytica]